MENGEHVEGVVTTVDGDGEDVNVADVVLRGGEGGEEMVVDMEEDEASAGDGEDGDEGEDEGDDYVEEHGVDEVEDEREDEGDDGVNDMEDGMDARFDELGARNGGVEGVDRNTGAALDMNDTPKEEATSVIINEVVGSESDEGTGRGMSKSKGPREIRAMDETTEEEEEVAAAIASIKGDVTDHHRRPKVELENERSLNDASIAQVARDFLQAPQVPQVPPVKAEVVERSLRPTLDVNEPPDTLKISGDLHSDVTAFRIVKAEEAKSLHDVEAKMVGVVTSGTAFKMAGGYKSFRSSNAGETQAAQATNDFKDIGPSSSTAADMAADIKERGPEGLASKSEMTELEREMELYEAFEREEQARLLAPIRGDEPYLQKDSQNDKKRALDIPLQERQRKLSRRMHSMDDRKKDEEDVCFICFDGGDLVLCDRRSCPKAYHLSCIGRDAAFFKKKGAWLCGWHFCSVCTKPGSFQCYTCPTAYCGSCINAADFLLLRKRKGLCEECLPIVSMIERNETTNADGVEVDFDDQETYECLFKEYWEDLKSRLSLTMPELDKDGKVVGGNNNMFNNGGSETEEHSENDESDKESDESDHDDLETLDGSRQKRKKLKRNRMGSDKMEEDLEEEEEDADDEEDEEEEQDRRETKPQKFESWASKELLDFVEHMKEDSTTPLSRFAVNKLLWSYIKRHKLQDTRKGSQINCDDRLKTIFGKDSVGQFEMFKHLQAHFPARGSADPKKSRDTHSGDDVMTEDDALAMDGIEDKFGTGAAKERRRGRRAVDEKFERPNSSEYAAITPKNISLIYLRRQLLRDLLDDPEFDNKVIDTFVRIRVPGISTKTETTYRLVLVTGTRVQEESYKAGRKMTNVVLEILNLQKKEDVTVDLVSNQDFTEEECQRLRQSIKCGFIKALTVGQVEEKAIALQEARVNDWFENERERLINLRDRANEKGRKKELRECVEKLQELSSPAFRAAKLQARPEVTADPHMEPGYESDVNEGVPLQGGVQRFRLKSSAGIGWDKGASSGSIGLSTWDLTSEEAGYVGRKGESERYDTSRSRGWGRGGHDAGRGSEKLAIGRDSTYNTDERDRSRVWDKEWDRDQTRDQDRDRGDGYNWNSNGGRNVLDQWAGEFSDSKYSRGEARAGTTPVFGQSRSDWGATRREAIVSATPSTSTLGAFAPTTPTVQSLAVSEKDKVWHYQDPTRTVQGPFSMEQLRKWNTTGLFPLTLTIWKTGQSQDNSILLTEALAGNIKEELWTPSTPGVPRSRSRDFAGGSPTPRANPSWGGDGGHTLSRAELGQSVAAGDWDSRETADRGGSWPRGQSSYASTPSTTGRADDWGNTRSRVEGDTWGSSGKGIESSSWGGNDSGKSTYGRSNSGREHDAPGGRDGSRSTRGARGSKKDVPCRFYAKGYCKRGDACEFWHG